MNKKIEKDRTPPFLSVVIPCYNEEKMISSTLDRVVEYLEATGRPWEVIVVDDGSRDDTVALANERAARHPSLKILENVQNRGKGFSVRRGMLEATGRYIAFSDADLSTPIEEADKLIHWLETSYDIAIGSRAVKGADIAVHQPWWREVMGKTFNAFVQAIAVRGIKDTQCGFKCFKQEAAKRVFGKQSLDGFSFDVEALFIAKRQGYVIKEVPVKWVNRVESRVNPLIHPLQMLRDLVRIRLRAFTGRYDS